MMLKLMPMVRKSLLGKIYEIEINSAVIDSSQL